MRHVTLFELLKVIVVNYFENEISLFIFRYILGIIGSFFPPREKTGADVVHIWDKDICRTLPLQYRGPSEKSGIKADLYTPPDVVFGRPNETTPENECFCSDDMSTCPSNGLQNISPCQYSKYRLTN